MSNTPIRISSLPLQSTPNSSDAIPLEDAITNTTKKVLVDALVQAAVRRAIAASMILG